MHVSSCRRKTWPVSTSTFRQSKHGTLRLAHDPPTLSILSSLIITRQNVVWFTQSSICCNDRFRANSCSTARSLLRLQSNAASAIAATAQVRFVPRCSHLQRSSPVSAARTKRTLAVFERMSAYFSKRLSADCVGIDLKTAFYSSVACNNSRRFSA